MKIKDRIEKLEKGITHLRGSTEAGMKLDVPVVAVLDKKEAWLVIAAREHKLLELKNHQLIQGRIESK